MRENPAVYLFRKTWHYSKGNRRNIVLYWLLFTVSECINMFVTPFVIAQIIAIVTSEGITEGNIGKLYFLLSLFIVRMLTSWACHGPARILEQMNAFYVRSNYRAYLLKGVISMPLEWHTRHHSGDITDKVNKGAEGLFSFAEDSFLVIKSVVKLMGCFAMIVYFNHLAAYVVLGITIVSLLVSMRFDNVIIPQYKKLTKGENQITESIVDSVANIRTVIILRVEKLIFEMIMNNVRKPFDSFKGAALLNEWKWFITSAFCDTMMVIVMVIYLHQHIGTGPGLLGGSVYLLLNYLEKMGELFFQFTSTYGSVVKSKFRVTNSEELATEFRDESLDNHVLKPNWKELEIRNLKFSYHTVAGQDLHLDNVNLCIRRGERLAFVGKRGSGKSTCLSIIRDLHHPQSLDLLLDGQIVIGGFSGIKRAIALVPQDPEIFGTRDATIGYNMTIGVPYAEALIDRYVDTVGWRDVLNKMPKGMESGVKEKGVNLSGGEKQGLALVRGLLACHEKEIVLLDEPTSSFDAVTERQVYQNIFREFAGKTIISSVHKLHLLPYFDRICLFSGGKIIASGTLTELLSTSSEFQKLWQAGTSDPD